MPQSAQPDRAASIFGNAVKPGDHAKALKNKQKYVRRFGDDTQEPYPLRAEAAPVIGDALGVRRLVAAEVAEAGDAVDKDRRDGGSSDILVSAPHPERSVFDLYAEASAHGTGQPVVIGTIRMGFGHYRIAMAMASAAHALGYTPYWFDLMGFKDTTASKIIASQNDLYSLGSRLSQKSKLFNAIVWEPMNYEGFRKLSYNASDQKAAELMVRPFQDLPSDVPYVGTHAWTAQAAVHAGLTHVVNAIPDNWPMALHLAEGAVHAIQTPNSLLGYKMLRGMQKGQVLQPMPAGSIVHTGHFIDHELVVNIDLDCEARIARREAGEPLRFLFSIGGAGAQQRLCAQVIERVMPLVQAGEATLWINVGDHLDFWESLERGIPSLADATKHFSNFDDVSAFAAFALEEQVEGVHAFYDADIFSAVYTTNLLMRACDVLVTKPSELAFYPVPKLMQQRVGGHERWGAVTAAELGDGTYELETVDEIVACMELMARDPQVVCGMCEHIMLQARIGTYDGAYNVIKLAIS
ncbi:MAG: hypothetical protein IJH83_00915 [Coriobacteriales bacterium]|nr:hypothetical protein [Coriobacteriales bacterium]